MKGIRVPLLVSVVTFGMSFALSTVYGYDAPTRALMTWRWLQDPFYITCSNSTTWVFGPMYFYLNSLSLLLFTDPNLGPRLFVTILGCTTIVPFYMLTREILGELEATLSGIAFAFYTLLVHLSVPGNSEPMAYFFVFMSLAYMERGLKKRSLAGVSIAAMFLTCACATRYECWIFIPVIGLYLLRRAVKEKERRIFQISLVFVIISMVFPISWMAGHYVNGHGLFEFVSSARRLDQAVYGLKGDYSISQVAYNTAFLPAALAAGMTPGIFLVSLLGVYERIRSKQADIILWCLAAYVIWFYYTFVIDRSSVVVARFAVPVGLFLMVYAGSGLVAFARYVKMRLSAMHAVVFGTAAVCFVMLGLVGTPADSGVAAKLNSVSPVVKQPVYVAGIVSKMTRVAESGESILLDTRYYSLRVVYLKLFEGWGGIIEFTDDPGQYMSVVDSLRPSVLVRSIRNKRLVPFSDPAADFLWIGADSTLYVRTEGIAEFRIFERAGDK